MSIGLHQRFLREHHRLFGTAADADAEHARRTPAGAHRRHGLQRPSRRCESDGFSIVNFDLFSEPPPLAAMRHVDRVRRARGRSGRPPACCRFVFVRLPAGSARIDARSVLSGSRYGAPHALVDHVGRRSSSRRPSCTSMPTLDERDDDAGVLADRPVPLRRTCASWSGSARSRPCAAGDSSSLVGIAERVDVVGRVVVRNELQRVGDARMRSSQCNRRQLRFCRSWTVSDGRCRSCRTCDRSGRMGRSTVTRSAIASSRNVM